jgi:hypothetical protein
MTFWAKKSRLPRRNSATRFLVAISVAALILLATADAQRGRGVHTRGTGKNTSDCALKKQQITDCPDQGCGAHYDPELNKQKNITSNNKRSIMRGLRWMKALPDPSGFTREKTDRDELRELGEGQKITVVAYALIARAGDGESCNCGLPKQENRDNHIVLVEPTLKDPILDKDEDDSETAEFTPRVRLQHPNFSGSKLQKLIDLQEGKLLVRVTGVLMFDTEHFLGRHLHRYNNWEIHPVLKLEYCNAGDTCRGTDDANWKNLDDER